MSNAAARVRAYLDARYAEDNRPPQAALIDFSGTHKSNTALTEADLEALVQSLQILSAATPVHLARVRVAEAAKTEFLAGLRAQAEASGKSSSELLISQYREALFAYNTAVQQLLKAEKEHGHA